MRPCW